MRWEVRGSISGKHIKTIIEAPTEPEARKLANTKFAFVDSVSLATAAAPPQAAPAPQAAAPEPPPPTRSVAAAIAPRPPVQPQRNPTIVLLGLVLAIQVLSLITYCVVEKGKRVNASKARVLVDKLASDRGSREFWREHLAEAKGAQAKRLTGDKESAGWVADDEKNVNLYESAIAEDLKAIESAERSILP